eukprot:1318929-Rhodomonas_salina.1
MQPPTGYSLPPGKCLLLQKTYRSRWCHVQLDRGGQKLIVSLYVDDGVCASDSHELYYSFLADLSKKFTLSDSGKLSWYLGVAIDHDSETGISMLSHGQETYIDTLRQPAATANVLACYADSDHAGYPDTRRSVTGYIVMLNCAAVSWQSTRQQVTALSTAEAEYYAASVAGTDVTYM